MRKLYALASLALLSSSWFAESQVKPDFEMKNEKEIARERAILPYIEKARATYPGAKKRFLAGLPPGHMFAVMIRLRHIDKAKKELTVNDVFVRVNAIKNGKVYGRLDPVFIAGYKEGDSISFPESEIINWVIMRPDGSEEGNYVGKFMDHYKPK